MRVSLLSFCCYLLLICRVRSHLVVVWRSEQDCFVDFGSSVYSCRVLVRREWSWTAIASYVLHLPSALALNARWTLILSKTQARKQTAQRRRASFSQSRLLYSARGEKSSAVSTEWETPAPAPALQVARNRPVLQTAGLSLPGNHAAEDCHTLRAEN